MTSSDPRRPGSRGKTSQGIVRPRCLPAACLSRKRRRGSGSWLNLEGVFIDIDLLAPRPPPPPRAGSRAVVAMRRRSFRDRAFDVVSCVAVSHHLDDQQLEGAVGELRRVTAGSLLFLDALRKDHRRLSRWLWSHDRAVIRGTIEISCGRRSNAVSTGSRAGVHGLSPVRSGWARDLTLSGDGIRAENQSDVPGTRSRETALRNCLSIAQTNCQARLSTAPGASSARCWAASLRASSLTRPCPMNTTAEEDAGQEKMRSRKREERQCGPGEEGPNRSGDRAETCPPTHRSPTRAFSEPEPFRRAGLPDATEHCRREERPPCSARCSTRRESHAVERSPEGVAAGASRHSRSRSWSPDS